MPDNVLTLDQRSEIGTTFARTLSISTRALPDLAQAVLGIDPSKYPVSQSTYTNKLSLRVIDNDRGIYCYDIVAKVGNTVEEEVLSISGRSSSFEIDHIPFPWSDGRHGTALETVEAAFKLIKEAAQRPISSGCVQAFFQMDELFWVSKRPNSDKIILWNGKYYIHEGSSNFHKVFKADGTFDVIPIDAISGLMYSTTATVTIIPDGRYFYVSALATVYVNQIPFSVVARYVPPEDAERFYETVVVDGERRFIDVEKPGVGFFKQALHSYSQRIEEFVPEEKLFIKGENDLYAKRDNSETPFLGWELEACTNLSKLPQLEIATKFKEQLPYMVFCKPDGSISPRGFETVSVPATLDAWKESGLTDALDVMRTKPYSMRSFEHSSCGFHVHVSRSALSVLDLMKMERFMHNPANRSFLNDVAGRGPNTYQNYDDKLFNKRKSVEVFSPPLSNSRYISELGVTWSNQSHIDERLTTWHVEGVGFASRIRDMLSFLNDYVQYASVFPALRTFHPEVYHQYSAFTSGRYLDFSSLCESPVYGYFNEGWEPVLTNVFAALCEGRPNFTKVVRYFLPEVPVPAEVVEEQSITPTASTIPAWKSKVSLKSKLSYKRVDSYRSARDMKGPVGKGNQRYDVLNTKNRNTVEFRLFKGTMNPTSVFRYLEFVDSLVRFVATTSASDEGVHFETYLKFLVTDSFNVARYENLVTFLLDKKYIERKNIRRRELIKLAAGDGDCNLSGVKAKSFTELGVKREPLYDITTRSAAERTFNNPVPVASPSFIEEEEPDFYDEADDIIDLDCDCDDCRMRRGEI